MFVDSSLPSPQVGYALGRSYGSAPRRNRLRRQLRVLVKEREGAFVPGVYVFGASPKAKELSFDQLADHLDRLLARISAKVAP